jgi:hypothetical protein
VRVWNPTHAFPLVQPPRDRTHIVGNFPAGAALALAFIDGMHANVTIGSGYVANQRLRGGRFNVTFERGSCVVGGVRVKFQSEWPLLASGATAVDCAVLDVAGPPAGLVIFESVEYGE